VDSPFACDVTVTTSNMKLLGGDESALQLEMLSLQHSSALRSKHNDSVESITTNF